MLIVLFALFLTGIGDETDDDVVLVACESSNVSSPSDKALAVRFLAGKHDEWQKPVIPPQVDSDESSFLVIDMWQRWHTANETSPTL